MEFSDSSNLRFELSTINYQLSTINYQLSTLKRLPSFTLFEMVIVGILSAIVMSLSFFVLNNFRRIALDYKENQETLYSVATLHRLMAQDFARCSKVEKTDRGITCIYPDREVVYEWVSYEPVARTQGKVTDEFAVYPDPKEVMHKYNAQPVYIRGLAIDELYFKTELEGESVPFHFLKSYPAAQLMQYEKQ